MEIVYTCNSLNNKNIRDGELVILRKVQDELAFEFGENENNIKKRYYADEETFNKDFEAVSKIKEKLDKEKMSSKREATNKEPEKLSSETKKLF